MPPLFAALMLVLFCSLKASQNQETRFSPPSNSTEDSDFEKMALISKIKHGGGTVRERAQMAESIKFCFLRAQNHLFKLSRAALDGLIQYLSQTADVDLLRRGVRTMAKKYAEISARDLSRFQSLEKIFPFKELLKDLKEISVKLEAVATKTPIFIAQIYKKKLYSKELFDQTKHRFIKAFKDFQLSKSVGGKLLENSFQELKQATIGLKLAMAPEKTLAEKTGAQLESIPETAAKLFSTLKS